MTVSTRHETRIPLHCACCGREVLAELVVTPQGRKVVITARRHGVQHCLAVALASCFIMPESAGRMREDETPLTKRE